MSISRIYLLMLSSFALVNCMAPVTPESVRQNPQSSVEFEVKEKYQAVFAEVLAQTRACYLHKPQVHQLTVEGKRNNADRTANITIERVFAMAGTETYLMIDFKSLAENATQVIVMASNSAAKKEVEMVKDWVLSDKRECKVSWLS